MRLFRKRVTASPSLGGHAKRAAFTLVELLVAITITAVLAGFSLAVIGQVSGLWKRTADRTSTEAQARYVLDQLEQDLSGALFRDDGRTWLTVRSLLTTTNSGFWDSTGQAAERRKPEDPGTLSYDVTATNLADARSGVAGGWLRFFTTARGANDQAVPLSVSAPVAVGYQIIRRSLSDRGEANAPRRYFFHRAQAAPAAGSEGLGVLENGYDLDALEQLRTPSSRDVVADNVIDFAVRLYVRERVASGGSQLRLIFPADEAGGLDENNHVHGANLPSQAVGSDVATRRFPDVVEVMIRVLSEDGATVIDRYESVAQRVFAPPGVGAAEHWWNLANAHSRVYTRRIAVRTQPL